MIYYDTELCIINLATWHFDKYHTTWHMDTTGHEWFGGIILPGRMVFAKMSLN